MKENPPLSPPSTLEEIFLRKCLGGGGQQIWRFSALFVFFRKKPKKLTTRGAWGSPNCRYPKSYFFGDLKPHAKFGNPTITPSGRKVTTSEEKEEREKTPLIVDT